ncbi:MAG: hypothetical protein EZS28_048535 [Streblomastix strix]|uniref:DH domain-containing protein n=1 Tax=Streblomastix strix TaxID=222440 RepID=A0A5J4TCF8_9EUKA|nr:MAG: hypothetical protein EZS28_048535 [Streblomastix strix]
MQYNNLLLCLGRPLCIGMGDAILQRSRSQFLSLPYILSLAHSFARIKEKMNESKQFTSFISQRVLKDPRCRGAFLPTLLASPALRSIQIANQINRMLQLTSQNDDERVSLELAYAYAQKVATVALDLEKYIELDKRIADIQENLIALPKNEQNSDEEKLEAINIISKN